MKLPGPLKESRPWTEEEDEMLYEFCSREMTFREIGDRLGRTKNSCVGRMNRLVKKLEKERHG